MLSRIQWAFYLLVCMGMVGCTGLKLPEAYIHTATFRDNRPVQVKKSMLQVAVRSFESQLPNSSQVGIKRVGVNEINGPLLPAQDVLPIVQDSVVTQLRLQGITVGESPFKLKGVVRKFFVDVDVDPATGRGKFDATVAVDLAVWDDGLARHLWQETYTGTASTLGQSVVDSAYERTLKLAFANLMNQIRQDDTLLRLQTALRSEFDTVLRVLKPPAQPGPVAKKLPGKATRPSTPRIVFLQPALSGDAISMTTAQIAVPINGLVASATEVEVQVSNARTQKPKKASKKLLQQAKLSGTGWHFQAYAFLTPGVNRVVVRAVDREGHTVEKVLTIRRQDVVDTKRPEFRLLEPQGIQPLSLTATKSRQPIFGYAADEIGIAEVQISGMTAYMTVATPGELRAVGLTGRGVKFAASSPLKFGDNTLEITVRDIHRNETRHAVTIQRLEVVEKKLNIADYYEKSVAVVIGIDHYKSWPQLTYAVKSAQQMKKALKGLGFNEVLMLTNEAATRSRVLHLLDTELPQKVGEGDRVLIFFAGHAQTGKTADGRQMGYLLPVDAQLGDYTSTAITMEQIKAIADRMPAKHVLYAVDACYSGLLLRSATAQLPSAKPETRHRAQNLAAKPAVQLVAAGRSGEQVGLEDGQGLFTRFLMQGLQGEADADNDRLITTSELGTYLSRLVSVTSDNRQTPQYGPMMGTGEVVFVY